MKLQRWSIRDLPGVADGEWDFERPDLVVVTGSPGSGKSRWLAAIAAHKECVAAYGTLGWVADLLGGASTVSMADWALTPFEQRFGGFPTQATSTEVQHAASQAAADPGMLALLGRYEPDRPLGRVLGIPAHRLPLRYPPSLGSTPLADRLLALVPDGAKVGASLAKLRRIAREQTSSPQVAAVNALLAEMGVGLEVRSIDAASQLEVHVGRGQRVAVEKLAASQQAVVLVAIHFIMARPKDSVLLFDAPEEDVTAERAVAMVTALCRAESTNQWIVATSERKAFELPEATVVDLDARRT